MKRFGADPIAASAPAIDDAKDEARPIRAREARAGWQGHLETWILLVVLSATVVRMWGMSISCGITRDESGLLWAIAGGWEEIYGRVTRFPQSVLLAWQTLAIQVLLGKAEWVLRLPSLLASLATFAGVCSFVSRRFGSSAALYGLVFALAAPVVTANGNALRPYPFGIGFAVVSWFLMTRFLETFSRKYLVGWAMFGALPAYFTVFFSLATFAQWLGALAWSVRTPASRRRGLALLPAGMFVLLAHMPLYGYLRDLAKDASLHSYVPPPTLTDLTTALMPPHLALALGAVLVTSLGIRALPQRPAIRVDAAGQIEDNWPSVPPVLVLGAFQAVLPMIILFGVSVVKRDVVVFHDRYFSAAIVAQALVFGAMYSRLGRRIVRLPVAVAVLVASLPGFWQIGRIWPARDLDFREAAVEASRVSASTGLPVFGVGVLAEACTYRYPLSEEDAQSILFVYRFYGTDVQPLARPEAPGGEAELREFIASHSRGCGGFLLLDHSIQPMEPLRQLLMTGFRPRPLWAGNGVRLELWSPRT